MNKWNVWEAELIFRKKSSIIMKIGSFQDNRLLGKLMHAARATGRCQSQIPGDCVSHCIGVESCAFSLHKSLLPRTEPIGGLVLGVDLAASLGDLRHPS